MNAIHENTEDGAIIMKNLYQKMGLHQNLDTGDHSEETRIFIEEINKSQNQPIRKDEDHTELSVLKTIERVTRSKYDIISGSTLAEHVIGRREDYDLSPSFEKRKVSFGYDQTDITDGRNNLRAPLRYASPKSEEHTVDTTAFKKNNIRVTIHMKSEKYGKLINLPGSLQELLHIGGQKLGYTPKRVVNEENAEIDDISVIRDGDHLFFPGE